MSIDSTAIVGSPWPLVGRILIVAGAVMMCFAMFLPWADGGISAWEAYGGGDIVMFLLALAVLGVGIALFFDSRLLLRVIVLCVSWLLATAMTSTATNATEFVSVGPYLAAIFTLTSAVGATLLVFFGERPVQIGAQFGATSGWHPPSGHPMPAPSSEPPPPRTRSPDPDAPKPGWYPDPADEAAERYWSGSEWTSKTRA